MGGVADFVGDVIGGVGDAIGGIVEGVGDIVGDALPIVSSVAAAIPGPWQIPALVYNTANAASKGNILGVIGGAMGLSNVGSSATSWFDAPVSDAAAMEAFTNMPLEAQNAYFNAGISPLEVGRALAQDQSYLQAFSSLPVEAQQAYISAGMNPSAVGSGMLSDQARNMQLWGQLPGDAQQAYLSAGYTPEQIGGMLASDATISAGSLSGVKTAYDAAKTVNRLFGTNTAGLLGTGANMLSQYLQGTAAKDAALATAAAQVDAAKIAAESAKFKPVGVTTRFGAANFGYDAAGNLTSAGYTLSPEVKALQDRLMGMAPGLLTQYEGAQAATAPMGAAAQQAMQLGQGYLGISPQEQAAKYMAEQQAILAPTREREYAALENRLLQQGRLGLATGATSTGMGAANPEIEALMNARRMQDLNLAAQATQGGMDYAKFGAGMVGTGGDLLRSMYGTQTAAYQPYQTAFGGATSLEELGKGALDIGTAIGAKTSTAAADAGRLMAQGMTSAAQTMQPANAYSPWGSLLAGTGDWLSKMGQPQNPYGMLGFDPTRFTLTPRANM